MFASSDIKDLTNRINEVQKKLNEPAANINDFVPLLRNMLLFKNIFFSRKDLDINGSMYRICVEYYPSFSEELGEEPTKMIEVSFQIVRVEEKKIYEEQGAIDKFLKRQPVLHRTEQKTSTILFMTAFVPTEHEVSDDAEIKDLVIYNINVEEFDILYAVNDYMRNRIRKHYEETLYTLEENVALKQLSPLPKNINFEG